MMKKYKKGQVPKGHENLLIDKKGQVPKGHENLLIDKKGQVPKGHENLLIDKKGQEEMVGFAFIVVIVAVVFLVFLSIAFNGSKDNSPQSFQVESYLQVLFTQTSDCSNGIKYLTIKELIIDSDNSLTCEDGRFPKVVLRSALEEISNLSWGGNSDSSTVGYMLNISSNGVPIMEGILSGDKTRNYRGASQNFSKNGNSYVIEFRAYG